MDYRQLFHQANALAAYSNYSSAYNHAAAATNARTYSYRLWTLANVLTNESSPCALYLLRARTDTSQSKKNSRVALIQPRAAPGFIVSFVGLFSFLPAHRVIVGGPPRGGGRVLRQVLALQQRLPVGQRPARPLADGSPRERRGHGGRHGRVRRVNKESRAAVRKKGVVFVAVAVWCSVDPRRPISPRGRRLDGSPFREQFGGRKRGRPGSSSSSRASRSIFRRWPLCLASLCFGLVPMALVLRFFGSTNSMKREENLPWNDPVRQQFHLFTTQRPPPESIRVNL